MTDKLSERMHKFRVSPWEPKAPETVEEADLMWGQSLEIFEIETAALEQRVEGLERIKSAFEYLAVESESAVIETEAAENGGLLSRTEHDKRIARFVRETLAAEEEA